MLVEWVIDTSIAGTRVRAGFTSRTGGFSSGGYSSLNLGFHVGDDQAIVARNRAAIEEEVPGIAWMDQVHGATIAEAVAGETARATDALVVDGVGAAAVMVADCVPLLLVADDVPLGAVVHVGRAGMLAGIAPAVARLLHGRGAQGLTAVVGPSICGRCYEVPEDMRDEAERLVPGSGATTTRGTPSIDIPAGIETQMRGLARVVRTGRCTLEDARYFSHRRETSHGRQAGRFAGLLEITRDTPA